MEKTIEEMTPEELQDYYEEKTALDRMEEMKLEAEEAEEYEEDLDLEDE